MALGQPPSTPQLARSTPTSIAQLSPALGSASSRSIDAIVTLLWPYSSSSKTFTLLLADSDFRLRRLKGQVKVAFRGASAKAVASSQVGIGDRVRLCLDGAQWVHLQEDVQTPGKSLDWDISYKGRVELEVFRNEASFATVNIDEPSPIASPRPSSLQNEFSADVYQTAGSHASISSDTFSSPSFRKHTYASSGSFLDPTRHIGAEDDGYVLGQGRKRTKFSRESGGWRYEDRSPSPPEPIRLEDDEDGHGIAPMVQIEASANDRNGEIQAVDNALQDRIESTVDLHSQAEQPHPSPGLTEFVVPPLPPPRFGKPSTPPLTTSADRIDEQTAVTTPYLIPLASPGLPLVSPLIKDPGSFGGYFLPPTEPPVYEVGAQSAAENTSVTDDNLPLASPFFQDFTQEQSVFPPPESFTSHQHLVDAKFGLSRPPLEQSIEESGAEVVYPSLDQVSVDDRISKPNEEMVAQGESDDELELISVREHIQSNGPAPLGDVEEDRTHTPTAQASNQASLQRDDLDMYGVSDDESQMSPTGPTQISKVYDSAEGVEEDSTGDRSRGHHTLEGNEPDIVFVDRDSAVDKILSNDTEVERQPQDWKDKLELSATESYLDNLPMSPPPFPFKQKWDHDVNREVKRRTSNGSRQSSYRGSIDGSSDRLDSDEDQDRIATETVESPVHHSAGKGFHIGTEALESANSPSTTPSDKDVSESGSEEIQVISAFEENKLEDDENIEEQFPRTSSDFDDKPIGTETTHLVSEPPRLSPKNVDVLPTMQDTLTIPTEEVTESIEETRDPRIFLPEPEEEVSRPRQQLVTPSTSQPREQHGTHMEDFIEIMKPTILTPQATQSFNDVPSLIPAGTNLVSTVDDTVDRTARRRSPRLTRRDQRASMVSPWFTPTKSSVVQSSSPEENPHQSSLRAETPPQTTRRLKADAELMSVKDVDGKVPDNIILDQVQLSSPDSEWPKGLRTPLGYFPSLSGLTSYFNQTVDIIGLCTSASTNAKRAPSGPKDYFTTLHISDPLISGLPTHEYDLRTPPVIQTTTVQIFRPWRNALPSTKEGDVILLRHFKVQSRKREMMLLSTEGSGWVVFPSDATGDRISGPPVEYGELEAEYAQKLQTWWHDTQNIRKPREQDKEGVKDEDAVVTNEKPPRKGHKQESSKVSIISAEGKDLQETITVQKGPDRATKSEDAAPRPPPSSQSAVQHELRDGRTYVDADGNAGHHRRTRSQKALEEKQVHQLRDGVRWRDE